MTRFFKLNSRLWVFCIFAVLAALCYGPVIIGPFFFDDEHFIQKNAFVLNFEIAKIFTSSVTAGAGLPGNFYRPIQQLSYAILNALFGQTPWVFHSLQIALHLLNAFFVFLLLKKIELGTRTAFFAGLLFVIHPIQTEAVAYISGLSDPMVTFFVLSGLLVATTPARKQSQFVFHLIGLIALQILALLSKENGLVIFPIFLVLALYLQPSIKALCRDKRFLATFGALGLVDALYLGLKFSKLTFSATSLGLTEARNIYTENLWVRLMTFLNVIWNYVEMIFWPSDLNYEKPYVAYVDLDRIEGSLGVILCVCFLFFCLRILRGYRSLGFLGLGWFFAGMIPYMGIIPLNAMYLEHWLYLPIVGILVIVARGLDWTRRRNKLIASFAIIGLVSALVALSAMRSAQWADPRAFYENELRYTQKSARIYNNLAMLHADRQELDLALAYYQRAAQLNDSYPQVFHNIAEIYLKKGELSKAEAYYLRALQIDSSFIYSQVALYNLYQTTHQDDKAATMHGFIDRIKGGRPATFQEIRTALQ